MIRLPHLFPRCPLGGSPTPTENYCPAGPGYADSYRSLLLGPLLPQAPCLATVQAPSRLVASSGPLCTCCSLYLKALLPTSTCQLPPSFSSAQLIPAAATHPHTPPTFYPNPSPAFLHRPHYLALSLCPPLDCRLHQDRFCPPCSLLSPGSPHSAWVRHSGGMGRRRMADMQSLN